MFKFTSIVLNISWLLSSRKLGVFLITASFLHGLNKPTTIVFNDGSDTLRAESSMIDSMLQSHLNKYREMGYWNASIALSENTLNPDHIQADVEIREIAVAHNVHFLGIKDREKWFMSNEYFLGKNGIGADQLPKAENRIRNLGYSISESPRISVGENGDYHLQYSIKDRPELNIDALAAFNQSSSADTLAWFGHVNIMVPNLDGRGKSIGLNWKRLKTDSEKFHIGYKHPWILNKPLTAIFRYGREVVDGGYQVIEGRIGLNWSLDWDRSLMFQYEHIQSLITHVGSIENPNWQAQKRQLLGLGYRHININRAIHKGFALQTLLDQQLNFEPASIRRLQLRLEIEVPAIYTLYLSQRIAMLVQNQSSGEVDPSILQPLGGVNSVRGYAEDIIRSNSTISVQHDLHIPLGAGSELLVLGDLGLYNDMDKVEYLSGFGFGVQLRTNTGPIRIIIASHKGVSLQNSFVHIEYSRGVSWIDQ